MPIIKDLPVFQQQNERYACSSGTFEEALLPCDNSQCARFMVASKLGKERVPADLFPGQTDRAREILKGANLL